MLKNRSTRDITEIALVGCVYVVLGLIFSSISFLPVQFRISEMVKAITLYNRKYAISMMIGNFLLNLFSPFAGPMELIFMPVSNLVGCLLGYYIGKYTHKIVGSLFIAVWISVCVSLTLKVAAKVPIFPTLWGILLSEITLLVIGFVIMEIIQKKGGISFERQISK